MKVMLHCASPTFSSRSPIHPIVQQWLDLLVSSQLFPPSSFLHVLSIWCFTNLPKHPICFDCNYQQFFHLGITPSHAQLSNIKPKLAHETSFMFNINKPPLMEWLLPIYHNIVVLMLFEFLVNCMQLGFQIFLINNFIFQNFLVSHFNPIHWHCWFNHIHQLSTLLCKFNLAWKTFQHSIPRH